MSLWDRLFSKGTTDELDEAQAALARAEKAKKEAAAREREVENLITDLRSMRLENNFARNIRATVRGRHT